MSRFEYIASGRNRAVFRISDRNVIKIPINDYGIADNIYEASGLKTMSGIKTAKCRLYKNFCLIMEYVEQATENWDDLPEWTFLVDCKQVGYNRNKKLVAYDFGRF